MKPTKAARFEFSEEIMADAFQQLLQSPEGPAGIGPFDAVYREVSCSQGRPDFIALRNTKSSTLVNLPGSMGYVGPAILSIIKPQAPRTLSYLINHSEFSNYSIKRSLRQLIASGHVEPTKTGSYRLGSATAAFKPELWVFELKLDNAKRAVFQAQQSRMYANRALIIVPPGQEKNYIRYRVSMKRWSIGLATFDPFSGKFNLLLRGRKARIASTQYQLYALSKMASYSSPA
jgi:hypothetical protein